MAIDQVTRDDNLSQFNAILDARIEHHLAPLAASMQAIAKRLIAPQDSPTVAIADAHKAVEASINSGAIPPRVKSVSELYSHTNSVALYSESKNEMLAKNFGGRQVMSTTTGEGSHVLHHSSQFEKAVIGAWFKYSALSASHNSDGNKLRLKLTEHDVALVNYALHEMPFAGVAGWNVATGESAFQFNNRKLHDYERKALLDDVLSGGLEAAPIAFDDAVITTPLLHGEFFPLVNLITVTRGRRIHAFSVGNPTFQWGIADGTNIPLYNTDAMIAAFDNNIHPASSGLTIGLDFAEDSPVNVAQSVIRQFGEAALEALDRICVLGNGITEPQGVFNATGTTAVLSSNGTSGPPTVADYSALQFALTKPFRRDSSVYASNDTTYARSRNMKVDPSVVSTDERRLLGMDFQNYQTLGYRHRINALIPNSKIGFFDFSRFRMYRRAGLAIRVERGGQALALANEQLIVCRMLFGGSLEIGGAGATMVNAQN